MIDESGLSVEEIEQLEAMIPPVLEDFAQMKTYAEDPFILDRGDHARRVGAHTLEIAQEVASGYDTFTEQVDDLFARLDAALSETLTLVKPILPSEA